MTIDSKGNVGIGSTSPAANLEVVGTGKFSETGGSGDIPPFSTDKSLAVNKGYVDTKLLPVGSSNSTLRYDGLNWVSTNVLAIDGTNKRVGIGITNPAASLHVVGADALGQIAGDSAILSRLQGSVGTNTFYQSNWLYRDSDDASGTWYTARLHDGISIDSSFLTPGTDTKTWWERDPRNDIQSWGTAAQAYMTIDLET